MTQVFHVKVPIFFRKFNGSNTFAEMKINEFIEIKPDKRFGKPVLKGTRISVFDVLNWLANGMTREEIIHDYPELSIEHINACLFFAASREGHLGKAS